MNELFDGLYKQYNETVYKYVLVSLNYNSDLADDCMQDIYVLLLQKIEAVLAHPNPGGFFIVTARNFIKRYKTAQYNNTKRLVPLNEKSATMGFDEHLESLLSEKLDIEQLKAKVLRQLNGKEIALYEMFYETGLSVAETAKRMRLTESNVKVRLFRLRTNVRKIVKESMD